MFLHYEWLLGTYYVYFDMGWYVIFYTIYFFYSSAPALCLCMQVCLAVEGDKSARPLLVLLLHMAVDSLYRQ